ncbi:MAG TPA: hypothetical protein VIU93_09470 [Gallionellaceae bacterium]
MNSSVVAYLVSVPNVWNSCLRVLKARGYQLSIECNAPADADLLTKHSKVTWLAQKDGIQLVASNPTELLGLAGVVEHQEPASAEPYWWVVDGDNLLEELYSSIGIGFEQNAKGSYGLDRENQE